MAPTRVSCSSPCSPLGWCRVVRNVRARWQHAARIPREGVVFRGPPDMSGPCSARYARREGLRDPSGERGLCWDLGNVKNRSGRRSFASRDKPTPEQRPRLGGRAEIHDFPSFDTYARLVFRRNATRNETHTCQRTTRNGKTSLVALARRSRASTGRVFRPERQWRNLDSLDSSMPVSRESWRCVLVGDGSEGHLRAWPRTILHSSIGARRLLWRWLPRCAPVSGFERTAQSCGFCTFAAPISGADRVE